MRHEEGLLTGHGGKLGIGKSGSATESYYDLRGTHRHTITGLFGGARVRKTSLHESVMEHVGSGAMIEVLKLIAVFCHVA